MPGRHPKEYLWSYARLAVWTRETDLFGARDVAMFRHAARAEPAAAGSVLAAALALREAAYAVLLGSRSGQAFSVVGAQARAARATSTLRRSAPAAGALARWELPADGVNTPLLGVAAQLDDLLCSSGNQRLRRTALSEAPGGPGSAFSTLTTGHFSNKVSTNVASMARLARPSR